MTRSLWKTGAAGVALFSFFAATGFVAAAELVRAEGKVSVNRGGGFEPASLGMVLKAGDKVLVGEGSSASLMYAEPGCVYEVAPASVATVSDVGPCVTGEAVSQGESVFATPVLSDEGPTDTNLTPLYVMSGLAAVGTVAAYFSIDNNNTNDHASDGSGEGEPPPVSGR